MIDSNARVWVAGRKTMIGKALVRALTVRHVVSGSEDDPPFEDPSAVERFFRDSRPEYVFLVAGKTAGIVGNQELPADLIVDNTLVAAHVIPAAWRHGVKKLLYLASSCIYPKLAPQPLAVSTLWTGPLEPTSASYAVAKLTGVKLCEAYRLQHGARFVSAIAADAYGPDDDFTPEHSHVVGALIRRIHDAHVAEQPAVDVWGSGTPRREFIYADDLADACIFAMQQYDAAAPINLGVGASTSIAELAAMVRDVVGYGGTLHFDRSRPDGTPFKGLDASQLHGLGWRPSWDLRRGLASTYEWFLTHGAH